MGAAPLIPPRAPRYRSLDLWRGVACLLVVLKHVTLYAPSYGLVDGGEATPGLASRLVALTTHLWIGVPFFFVISGYCIAATADSMRRRRSGQLSYFVRRVRRIYPPYWVHLILLCLFVVALEALVPGLMADGHRNVPPPSWLSKGQWLGNLTLTESWRYHLGGGQQGYYNTVAWTLCYEEQFYIVVGLLLLFAPRRFFLGAVGVTAVTVALYVLISNRTLDGFFFDGYWTHFAAGVLVYYRVNYATRRGVWVANLILLAGLIAFAVQHPPFHRVGPRIAEGGFFACGFALLLSFLHPWDGALAAAVAARPLLFCGRICYSLYLIHWPVCKAIGHGLYLLGVRGDAATLLITLPIGVATSVFLAWGFYRLCERRFLNAPAGSGRAGSQDRAGVASSSVTNTAAKSSS
jgi:peptidoglycan/LPS O-acetylase OafA/YrhL